MAFIFFNPNPAGQLIGDCTVRAISKITRLSWDEVYTALCLKGFEMRNLPSANAVWSAYLLNNGFKRSVIPNTCPDCYTVSDFCIDHPMGEYILATGSHVVAVIDGNYYDTWDSGGRESYDYGRSYDGRRGRDADNDGRYSERSYRGSYDGYSGHDMSTVDRLEDMLRNARTEQEREQIKRWMREMNN